MATYWVSFHLHDDAGYPDRYDHLIEAIAKAADNDWWDETTSFIVFESTIGISAISNLISLAIDQRVDKVLLGQTEFKSMILIGNKRNFRTLQALVPFVK